MGIKISDEKGKDISKIDGIDPDLLREFVAAFNKSMRGDSSDLEALQARIPEAAKEAAIDYSAFDGKEIKISKLVGGFEKFAYAVFDNIDTHKEWKDRPGGKGKTRTNDNSISREEWEEAVDRLLENPGDLLALPQRDNPLGFLASKEKKQERAERAETIEILNGLDIPADQREAMKDMLMEGYDTALEMINDQIANLNPAMKLLVGGKQDGIPRELIGIGGKMLGDLMGEHLDLDGDGKISGEELETIEERVAEMTEEAQAELEAIKERAEEYDELAEEYKKRSEELEADIAADMADDGKLNGSHIDIDEGSVEIKNEPDIPVGSKAAPQEEGKPLKPGDVPKTENPDIPVERNGPAP